MSEQPTDQTDEPTLVQNDDPHPDPFAGNSVRFTVTRPITVGQLQDEIARRTKTDVQVVLSTDEPDHIASQARPAVLFVSPGNLNKRVVQEVIDAHVPAPMPVPGQPGADPAPMNTINPALLPDEVQPLVQKLKDGETLKTSEPSDLLRAVFGLDAKE